MQEASAAPGPSPRTALRQPPHLDDVEERAAILEYDAGCSREAAEAVARHGLVVELPSCPSCLALGYRYQDGFFRCTAIPAHSGRPAAG